MKPLKAYLLTYNVVCIVAWAYLWVRALPHLIAQDPPNKYANEVHDALFYTQHLAILEIVHAATGIVGSPLLTTIIQVFSRLAMLDFVTYPAWKVTSHHVSFYLMVVSWATVEVPRYSFYAAQLLLGDANIPSWLFWMRYSLFAILYPTGISGEMLQQVASYPYWRSVNKAWVERLSHIVLVLYCFFGPYMIWSMVKTRSRAYVKRNVAKSGTPPPSPSGLVWPITNTKTGERSSTETSKKIWAAAARVCSDTVLAEQEAQRIMKEKNWRWNYTSYVAQNVLMNCESSDDALAMARAGLAEARRQFQFCRDGQSTSLEQYMSAPFTAPARKIFTGVIQGSQTVSSDLQLEVPYRGRTLQGQELFLQLDQWVTRGTIEESAGAAIKLAAMKSKEWLNLQGVHVVMLGASSAMGPFDALIAHGATVIAVDLPRPKIWKMLIDKVRNSPGKLIFPLSREQSQLVKEEELHDAAGCDMLTHTPELMTWLTQLDTQNRPMTVGNYTYLDGALYVQLALAGEVIMERLCRVRPNTKLAFLCTPTDDHLVPDTAREAAKANARKAPLWQKVLMMMGMLKGNWLVAKKNGLCMVDAMVSRQGPNYALAKRLQHWRAIVSRAEGHVVSSNVAPSTYTLSVVSNPQFKAGYSGWKYFRPLEVFMPETSNTVMFALLCHDLFNKDSKAQPDYKLDNPLSLFTLGSFHGGIWRCAFTIESVGIPAALTYYVPKAIPYVVGGVAMMWAQYQYVIGALG